MYPLTLDELRIQKTKEAIGFYKLHLIEFDENFPPDGFIMPVIQEPDSFEATEDQPPLCWPRLSMSTNPMPIIE